MIEMLLMALIGLAVIIIQKICGEINEDLRK